MNEKRRRPSGTHANLCGARIREMRVAKGWTQDVLMAKLQLEGWDVCHQAISRMENGKRTITDIELVAFAKVLGTTPNDLLNF